MCPPMNAYRSSGFSVTDPAGPAIANDLFNTRSGGFSVRAVPSINQTVESTTYTVTGAYADVTGLSVVITPRYASSKVRIQANISTYLGDALTVVNFKILRGATLVQEYVTSCFNNNTDQIGICVALDALDSPATVAATTYKVQAMCPNNVTAFINEPINGGDIVVSTLTVTEIPQA